MPAATRLIEFDNVHLAAYARVVLRREGIDCLIQAYHYRRLLYIFQPLVKMALYIPIDQRHAAAKLLRMDQFEVT